MAAHGMIMCEKEETAMFKKNRLLLVVLFLGFFVFLNLTSVCAAEISRDARKYMIRGQAAMEEAKNASDYRDAVKEFKKAVEYAPDWADAWFNLGVAQERAKDYAGAMNSLKKYLELNPTANDRDEVEGRIYKLEYLVEKKAKAKKAEREKKESSESLTGTWSAKRWACPNDKYELPTINSRWWRDKNWPASVNVHEDNFSANIQYGIFTYDFSGKISGNLIRGELKLDKMNRHCSNFPYFYVFRVEGEIFRDQNKILLETIGGLDHMNCRFIPHARFESWLLVR
jgi:tetratricopeptide (TPR) repeat protein